MSGKQGVKEIIEMLDALKVMAAFTGAVLKDGKVNVADVSHLMGLVATVGVIKDGFEGAKEALEEVKDLQKDEVLQIIGKIYEGVAAFEIAKK